MVPRAAAGSSVPPSLSTDPPSPSTPSPPPPRDGAFVAPRGPSSVAIGWALLLVGLGALFLIMARPGHLPFAPLLGAPLLAAALLGLLGALRLLDIRALFRRPPGEPWLPCVAPLAEDAEPSLAAVVPSVPTPVAESPEAPDSEPCAALALAPWLAERPDALSSSIDEPQAPTIRTQPRPTREERAEREETRREALEIVDIHISLLVPDQNGGQPR